MVSDILARKTKKHLDSLVPCGYKWDYQNVSADRNIGLIKSFICTAKLLNKFDVELILHRTEYSQYYKLRINYKNNEIFNQKILNLNEIVNSCIYYSKVLYSIRNEKILEVKKISYFLNKFAIILCENCSFVLKQEYPYNRNMYKLFFEEKSKSLEEIKNKLKIRLLYEIFSKKEKRIKLQNITSFKKYKSTPYDLFLITQHKDHHFVFSRPHRYVDFKLIIDEKTKDVNHLINTVKLIEELSSTHE